MKLFITSTAGRNDFHGSALCVGLVVGVNVFESLPVDFQMLVQLPPCPSLTLLRVY